MRRFNHPQTGGDDNRHNIDGLVNRGTRHLTRTLDNFPLATLLTHKPFNHDMISDTWRLKLQRMAVTITDDHSEFVTADYACQYVCAIYNSNITAADYDPVSRVLTTPLNGSIDLPTRFNIFSDQRGKIEQSEATVTTGFTQQFGAQKSTDAPPGNPIDMYHYDSSGFPAAGTYYNYWIDPILTAIYGSAKASQTITSAPLPDIVSDDPSFTMVERATSSLPVTFTVSGACSNSGRAGRRWRSRRSELAVQTTRLPLRRYVHSTFIMKLIRLGVKTNSGPLAMRVPRLAARPQSQSQTIILSALSPLSLIGGLTWGVVKKL